MSATAPSTALVAGIAVADLPAAAVVERLSEAPDGAVLAFALHVGGLNQAAEASVRDAYAAADLTYADGAAVVLLARLAGAHAIERAATTDIGPDVLSRQAAAGRGRTFLLGGPPGLAAEAGEELSRTCGSTIVGTMSGFDVDERALLAELRRTNPDVVVVGLGAPREMLFLARLRDELPPALYLTCGGWFGFLVGSEVRAPAPLRRLGLEWVWRLAQHPRRLLGRYAMGLWTTGRMALRLSVRRVLRRR